MGEILDVKLASWAAMTVFLGAMAPAPAAYAVGVPLDSW
jgi:hypothetical protein